MDVLGGGDGIRCCRQTGRRGRKPLTVAEMLATYKDFLLSSKAITFQGLDKLVKDIGAFQKIFNPKDFPLEQVLGELGRNQSPVMLIHGLYPMAAHTVVIFGVKIVRGEAVSYRHGSAGRHV